MTETVAPTPHPDLKIISSRVFRRAEHLALRARPLLILACSKTFLPTSFLASPTHCSTACRA